MLNKTSRLWLEAAIKLAEEPSATINCPKCKIRFLKVKDEPIELWGKVDRYIYCDNCKRYEVITMSDPNKKT